MSLFNKKYKDLYDTELKKQADAYMYYIENIEGKINNEKAINEGEHESVPLICIKEEDISLVSEDDEYKVYECKEYFIYESKRGMSSIAEKVELVTNALKLNADYIYSDVDCITCDGKRSNPFYKSTYAIDTARCFDYYKDFYAVKKNKSRIEMECLDTISHVSKVLFHYILENNTDNPNEIYIKNSTRYLTDEFYLDCGELEGIKDEINIIIPSKDNPQLLLTCLRGIKNAKIKSGINTLKVVIVDNGSNDANKEIITRAIKDTTEDTEGLSIEYIYEKADFNFSNMCNVGAAKTSGKYLLFLNDDIEITDELFLLKLLYFARMDHIGAVGCKLLYPGEERRIQHIGITNLKYAGPSHKLSTFEDSNVLYYGRNRGVHDVLGVTGACLMVSREKYFKIGGFHDKMKVGYNDVDLCISLYEQGLNNVVNNECVLIHHESISRGCDAASEAKLRRLDEERTLLYERHNWLTCNIDPFYNINLAEDFLDYRVNVIPDYERRDYESSYNEKLSLYAKTRHKPATEDIVDKGMFYNLESVRTYRGYREFSGWALINKKDNYLYDTFLVLRDENSEVKVYETAKVLRKDLSTVFPEAKYSELSGFFARIPITVDDKSNRFGLLIVNKKTGKKYYAGFTKSDI